MASQGSEAAYNEVFEDAPDSRQAQTIHHIRANSSIMQLKKILGEQPIRTSSNDTPFGYRVTLTLLLHYLVANRGEIRK
jgi:hypothetical protein